MTKFFTNPCNIYITLSTFYLMQGTIIPTGGTTFSQILLILIMLMGIYYVIKTICLSNTPPFFYGLNLLFLTLVVYGIILLFSDHRYIITFTRSEVPNSTYLKNILMSFPNIYIFYYFTRKRYLTGSMLKQWTFVFFAVAIFKFIDFQMTSISAVRKSGNDVEEITNNMGYLFATLIPSIYLFREKTKLQYAMLIVCMVFIVIGMKRGAIILGTISIIYYIYFNFKNVAANSKLKLVFFSFILITAFYFIISYMMQSSEYFMSRIAETKAGYSSGRDDLYATFWNHFRDEIDPIKFMFGNGANATLDIGINYAHNDWLELAINQGVLGLAVYLIYWICFIKTIISCKKNPSAKFVLTLVFISFFIRSTFSMSYTEYSIMTCTAFGYFLAHYGNYVYMPQKGVKLVLKIKKKNG